MKITVINGTEHKGITFKLKEIFLSEFEGASVTEFYLPTDCPNFCAGCKVCFLTDEHLCKDAVYIQKIEKALLEADLLVFTSPAYVFHTTGAMKAMLDHFGYRWIPHRPAREMFGKRAIILTQCLGSGEKSAAKDIKDSLSWWGISDIKICTFKLFSEVIWKNIPEKRRNAMTASVRKIAKKLSKVDYTVPARTSFTVKMKFFVTRLLQKALGKKDPEYTDYNYWKTNGWLGSERPWKDRTSGK